MSSKRRGIRFLLDEHYPEWLAAELSTAGHDTTSVVASAQLRGAEDQNVLAFAAAQRRVVVTEDARTFPAIDPPPGLGSDPVVWWLDHPA